MFAHIGIDQPIENVVDDWDYLNDKIVSNFSMFTYAGDNIIGIRRREITLTEIIDPIKGTFNSIVMTPEGLIAKNHERLKIHITPGGVPHRVEHSFGLWHINDMDELYLPIPAREGETLGHFIVLMQTPAKHEIESFAQFCQQCLTMLHEHVYEAGKLGISEMVAAEATAIRTYNADPKLRVCPECGHRNPLAYSWNAGSDTPEQAEARRLW
jgi:hypothetical protein